MLYTLLPSERTLRNYTHVLNRGVGFLPDVTAQLVSEADIHEDKDRYVVLMWDEMKIKEDLVFDKHTCELIGFAKAGEIITTLTVLSDSVTIQLKMGTQTLPLTCLCLWLGGLLRVWNSLMLNFPLEMPQLIPYFQ